MLLIWGWRSLLTVLGVGTFHCPKCRGDVGYRLVRPRRWFTFFFIPLIPLKWGEQFVECGQCKSGFQEQILSTPTNDQLHFMLALAVRASYGKLVAAAFRHSESMIEAAAAAVRHESGDDGYNEANVIADVEAFGSVPLAQYLDPIAEHLTTQGRENLVVGLVGFAGRGSDRAIAAPEVVEEVAAALGLSAAHLGGIVGAHSASNAPGADGS